MKTLEKIEANSAIINGNSQHSWNDFIINGENLDALHLLQDNFEGKIDLVYIDPPFASNNVFTFSENRHNTISSKKDGKIAYIDKLRGDEFLEFLRVRLILIKKLMSEKGSIYLHIDYKVGHYVKILMDEIFGIENFRNDITRVKCNPKNFTRNGYGNIKDMVLFYSKGKEIIWNEPKTRYSKQDIEKLFPKTDEQGRRYTTVPLHAPGETENGATSKAFRGILPPTGRHWRTDVANLEELDNQGLVEWSSNGNPRKKIFADEQFGKRVQDIWEYKDPQYPIYPTEKNLDMLDLIVKTSSNEDSIVLDCFCGSGTTLQAAKMNKRKWIGVDKSEKALEACLERLNCDGTSLFHRDIQIINI